MPQVVHDATSTKKIESPADPLQWDHPVGTGDGRYLRVSFRTSATVDVEHVKYAGELMEELDRVGNFHYYWMAAPAEGTNKVEVRFSDQPQLFVATANSYFLVDQFVPHGTHAKDSAAAASSPTLTASIVLEEGGLGVDAVGARRTGGTFTQTSHTGQTGRGSEILQRSGDTERVGSGASDESGDPGTITMGWDFSGSSMSAEQIAVPLRPMSAARERIYEYHENRDMSKAAGSPQVRDAQGRLVKPEQLRANNYVRVEGPHMISTHVYDDAAENPALIFAEHVGVQGENIVLTPSKESTAARILGKLTRR